MEYSNPELPEDINTSRQNPLKELLLLSTALIAIVFISIWLLVVLIDNFADKIPFELEQDLPISGFIEKKNTEKLPVYLQKLSQKIISNANIPDDMNITVHYINDATVNAFATLGGHIVLYRGLIEKLKYEDELAMVIAHEVAHIKYRHPILAASHGVVVGLVLSVISTSMGDSIANDLVGTTGMASLLRFSREFEYQSDKDAVSTLIKTYGHADGAAGLLTVFKNEAGKESTLEFLATHPLTDKRISQINELIASYNISGRYQMKKFPVDFKTWLTEQNKKAEKAKNK